MFRQSSEEQYESSAEGGVRHLFTLGAYDFHDTMDAEDHYHHFVLEAAAGSPGLSPYEVDRDTMYEFMARFLAGVHEMDEFDLDRSPSHDALLDVLEIATARARAGESGFSWEEFDAVEPEVLDGDAIDPDEDVEEDEDDYPEEDEDDEHGEDDAYGVEGEEEPRPGA